ncbi:MAG: 2-C-methyl-D-erythritol 2,4-cyclodiphosphate synthase [Opitutales bacterium]
MKDSPVQPPFRIGHGFDIHRTGPGSAVTLGGIRIKAPFALLGHSDADVLLHALADAILGALALPDIGHYFPPSDPQWRGMDSRLIVEKAVALADDAGYRIQNVDLTLITEAPKIAPHREAMRERIADCLNLAAEAVGLKATTHEQVGALGASEGVAAQAVCLLALAKG